MIFAQLRHSRSLTISIDVVVDTSAKIKAIESPLASLRREVSLTWEWQSSSPVSGSEKFVAITVEIAFEIAAEEESH
jgi:hypothetical protein